MGEKRWLRKSEGHRALTEAGRAQRPRAWHTRSEERSDTRALQRSQAAVGRRLQADQPKTVSHQQTCMKIVCIRAVVT
jgi:hypothetical protein